MNTPIYDFVTNYCKSGTARLHMPGHKGMGQLGCEARDITEISGADSLWEADGIIAESEHNAAGLFGSAATFYSTEGSSQCIRAMLYLAAYARPGAPGERPLILAARNVHRTFVLAAALLDLDVCWLWPDTPSASVCSCPVSAEGLRRALRAAPRRPAAVYLTSPDYLGTIQPVEQLAPICHEAGIPLLVDNAHGAYLHFLHPARHPLDLGADICCDSAHKTLPVLTGGAYLHLSQNAPAAFLQAARQALAIFGSTSPSYLILQSLDLANRYLSEDYPSKLAGCAQALSQLRQTLSDFGWKCWGDEPLKLTLNAAFCGQDGRYLADQLRKAGIECEHADRDFLVLMATPETSPAHLTRIKQALGRAPHAPARQPLVGLTYPPCQVLSIRQAIFSKSEEISTQQALGRVLASPTVSCPPAVPILVSGERIDEDAQRVFGEHGIDTLRVVC